MVCREPWGRAALFASLAGAAALSITCASFLGVDDVLYLSDAATTAEVAVPDAASPMSATTGYLYAIGGVSGNIGSSTVFVARIRDGSLEAWSPARALPRALFFHSAAALGNVLVVTAGFDDTSSSVTGATYQTTVGKDGELDPWVSVTATSPLWRRGQAVAGGRMYLVGGALPGPMTSAPQVEYGSVESGEVKFRSTSALPLATQQNAVVASGSFLYSLGGYSKDVWIARIDDAGGIPMAWTAGAPLVKQFANAPAVAIGAFLFTLGGSFGTPVSTVFRSRGSPDGTLEPWLEDTAGLPEPRISHAAAVFDNRIYMVGGSGAGDAGILRSVRIGTLMGPRIAWAPGPDLPEARANLALVAVPSQ